MLPRLDGLLLNDSEAKLLTGEDNMVRAGAAVRRLGPKFVIIKRGEHGAMLCSPDGVSVVPAFPTADVVDPTGAGDSFAGGLLGYLEADGVPWVARPESAKGVAKPATTPFEDSGRATDRLRRAMAYGTVVASLTVEGFGLDRLKATDLGEIEDRMEQYRKMLPFTSMGPR